MAVLASAIINRVLDQFRYRDPVLTTASSATSGDTTITVNDFLPNIGPGNIIQIEDEYILVTNVSGTGPMSLTVIRAWLSSTAATHAAGVPVYVNPRVLGTQVLELMNEALDLMYPKLYAVDTEALVFSGSTIGYGLPANCDGVLRVDYEADSRAKYWKELFDWVYKDNADSTDFTNGKAIMIQGSMEASAAIRVVYRTAFTRASTAATDLIATSGMAEYMTNLLYYYPMARLMTLEEVDRSDSTGAAAHQIAQDVPAFLALRTAQWYQARYDDLLEQARVRLIVETRPRTTATGYGH